jgi:predicted metal-dependent hydrolase
VTAELSGTMLPYTIKFQRRKTLGLYVLADGALEVRAPRGVSRRRIEAFVEARREWAVAARERQLQRQQRQNVIAPGAVVWLHGEPLRLELRAAARAGIACEAGRLLVEVRDPADLARVERQLDGWYRQRAERVFAERLALNLARFPELTAAPELRLRRMRRRWGSCSRAGCITLNVELIKLPLVLLDYVIVHELCHLFEFNHSPRFYRRLEQALPDWQPREAELKHY